MIGKTFLELMFLFFTTMQLFTLIILLVLQVVNILLYIPAGIKNGAIKKWFKRPKKAVKA